MSDNGAPTTPPGWYQHPTMYNTLCYWDGEKWTDQVQPIGATADTVSNGIWKVLVILAAIGLVVFIGYQFIHADDDVDCATRNADHALNNEPLEDCN